MKTKQLSPYISIFSLLILFFSSEFYPATECIADSQATQTQYLTIEAIAIKGARKTKHETILRYLTFGEGDMIDPRAVEVNYKRLVDTNFFKRVNFSTRPGSLKGKVILIIEIEDRIWPYFEIEGSYSEIEGWYFSPLCLRLDNLFGGGRRNKLRLLFGDRLSGIDFDQYAPYLWGKNVNLNTNLYILSREIIHYFKYSEFQEKRQISQKVGNAGFKLKYSANRGIWKYFSTFYQLEAIFPDSVFEDKENGEKLTAIPAIVEEDTTRTSKGLLGFNLASDTRDNNFYPTCGIWTSFSAEFASPKLGGKLRFERYIFDFRVYQQLFGRNIVALHLRLGSTTASAPFYERFYLGGANSLRGYKGRSLTPVGWGTRLALGNIEYRFPLKHKNYPKHWLTGVIFYDFGSIGHRFANFERQDLRTGAGLGFRIRMPVLGLLRMDIAYPLETRGAELHISIGHTF